MREAPAEEQLQHLLEVRRLDLREEPDLADVDAEQRHVVADHGAGGAQERAVAAEHDEHVRARQLAMQGLAIGGRAAHWSSPWTLAQLAARSRSATAASLVGLYANPIRFTDAAHAGHRLRDGIESAPSVPVGGSGARRAALRGRRRRHPEVEQELAVALGPQDRRGDRVDRLEARGERRLDDLAEDAPVDRRVANDAVPDLRRGPPRTGASRAG